MEFLITKSNSSVTLYLFSALLIAPLTLCAQTPSEEDYRKEYEPNWGLAAINADAAYKIKITGKDVAIGIVDYGIDANHPEFKNRSALFTPIIVKSGGTSIDGGKLPPSGNSNYSHGVHVGGTMVAAKDGAGMHGVAYDSKIFSARMLSPTYAKAFNTEMNALQGNFARAINHSWTLTSWKGAISDLIQDGQKVSQDAILSAVSNSAKSQLIQVWALGNDFLDQNGNPRSDDPGNYGALYPYFDSSVKDYWVAVANVDQNQKIYKESNHCSIAADWCLAAPGAAIYSSIVKDTLSDPKENPYSYAAWSGTSMAAPHVTGAIALAMQRFPYLDNKQIREVILTTANNTGHLSDTTIYGQGLLDVAKAMQGPGKFRQDWDVLINVNPCADLVDQTCHVWSNDISGPGNLNKLGTGTLTLSGKNSYRGMTYINEGELNISGELNGSDITMADGLLSLTASGKIFNTTTLIENGKLYAAGNVNSTNVRMENGLFNLSSTGQASISNIVLKDGEIDIAGTLLSRQLQVQGGLLNVQASGNIMHRGDMSIEGGQSNIAGKFNIDGTTRLLGGLLYVAPQGVMSNNDLAMQGGQFTIDGQLNNQKDAQIKGGKLIVNGRLNSTNVRVENGLLNVSSTGQASINNAVLKDGQINIAGTLLSRQLQVQGGKLNVQASGNIMHRGDMSIEGGQSNIAGKFNIDGTTRLLGGLLYVAPQGVMSNNDLAMQGGQFTIDGQLNNQKDAQIKGGKLIVNGRLNSAELVIATLTKNAPATLRGTGFINSPTIISGILAPGNSAGTLTFFQPLTMTSSSQTLFDIDGIGTANGAGNYSRVRVLNTMTLGGSLQPRLRGIEGQATNFFTPGVGDRFAAALFAQDGFVGGFDTLVQPIGLTPGRRFDVLFYGNQADLAVASTILPGSTLGDNAAAGATVLNALRDTPMALRPGAYNSWLGQATGGSASDVTYRAIGGQIYADSTAWGVSYQDHLGQVLFDRLAGFGKGRAALTPGYSLWLEVPYRTHSYLASPSRLDTQGRFGGVLLGLERQFERLQVGAALGIVDGRITQDFARMDMDGYSFSVYGRYALSDAQQARYRKEGESALHAGLSAHVEHQGANEADVTQSSGPYVVGRLSYASLNARSQRSLPALATTLNSQGQQYYASAELGIGTAWWVRQWQINPELRLRYTHSQRDGVDESGVNPNDPFALSLEGSHAQRTSAMALLRTSRRIALGQGHVVPQMTFGVQRDIGATPTSMARLSNLANLYGQAGPWSIQQSAAVDERTLFRLGLGVQWQHVLWSAKVHVDATTSSLGKPFSANTKALEAELQWVRRW